MLTTRGLLLLLLAAPLIAAGSWFRRLEWVAGGYLLFCLAVLWMDRRLAQDISRFEVRRMHDNRLSLGADNAVLIEVRNIEPSRVNFQVRDEAPEAFELERRVLEGSAGARDSWRGGYTVRPLQRGNYEFGDIHLRWEGPLGLTIRQARVPAASKVKVYPNLLDIRRYDLLLKQNRLQEFGLRQTRMFGEGTEYERLREYQPDDDYRRIDWKATARRRRPVTIEHQTERSQNIILMLDTGRMMQSPVDQIAKLDYVINAALLLAYVATGKGDQVGLLTFSDRVTAYVSPKPGRGQFYRLLELLYRVEPEQVEPDYQRAFAYLGLKHRKRSLVVLFTDLSGGLGLDALVDSVTRTGSRSLPLVVTINDPLILEAARQLPENSHQAYRRAAAEDLLEERELTIDKLRRRGIPTLDVPANRLSPSVINRYLEIKGRQRL